jgi:hypothetical protein
VRDRHIIDYESRLACVGDKPLELHKYIYGGLGVRGNRAWFDATARGEDAPDPARCGECDFLTSEGKTRRDGNHTRPKWVDLFGDVDGKVAGLAVLEHPANFRFPQPVRLHPNKPYFSISPPVVGDFEMKPGETYVSRYRIVLHDSAPEAKAIDALWNDYAEPPVVQVVSVR